MKRNDLSASYVLHCSTCQAPHWLWLLRTSTGLLTIYRNGIHAAGPSGPTSLTRCPKRKNWRNMKKMYSVLCIFSFTCGALCVGISIHRVPFISQGENQGDPWNGWGLLQNPTAHVCPLRKYCFDPLQIALLISIERCLLQPEWLNWWLPQGQALCWGLPFLLKACLDRKITAS